MGVADAISSKCAKVRTVSPRIAVVAERSNGYARGFIEGVVDFAESHRDWRFELLDPAAFAAVKVTGFDGFVCRLPDQQAGRRLERLGRPVVEAMGKDDFDGFVSVLSDVDAVSRIVADHFLSRFHVNFAYCGFDGQRYSARRAETFARCLAERGKALSVYEAPVGARRNFRQKIQYDSPIDMPDARELEHWLRKLPKPVALFCCNDRRAFQVLALCRKASLRVPQDVAICGVDNDALLCDFSYPRLTSVDPDARKVGYTAVRTLADMIVGSGPDVARAGASVVVPPRGLVARASTALFLVEPEWMGDALVFIRQYVGDRLTASDVFAFLGRSRNVIGEQFRKLLGHSVQAEIASVRLEMAKRLLSDGALPVNDVARMSGYATPEYFWRCFSESCGVSPTQYRDGMANAISGRSKTVKGEK